MYIVVIYYLDIIVCGEFNMLNIHELLENNHLSHFTYYEEQSRIVYEYESGTSLHIQDFNRLLIILNENNIKHEDIGVDVILIEQD